MKDSFFVNNIQSTYLLPTFTVIKIKLVIEVDGEIHFNKESQEHDDGRTREVASPALLGAGGREG